MRPQRQKVFLIYIQIVNPIERATVVCQEQALFIGGESFSLMLDATVVKRYYIWNLVSGKNLHD